MAVDKKYLNVKYNTLYFPYNENLDESTSQTNSSSGNYGGNKRFEIGGGKTTTDNMAIQGQYGLYCKARGLVGFDTNDFDSSLSADESFVATIKLYHLPSINYVPSTMTIEFYPITASWIGGTHIEGVTQIGYSNWWYRNTTDLWTTPGGWDVDASMSSFLELTPSNQDIELDITNMIKNALSGNIRYYGILMKLPDSIESLTSNTIYFKKEIYSGDFTLPYMIPRIDISYDNYMVDDRSSFIAGQTGRLYFHNFVNGNSNALTYNSASAFIIDENDKVIVSSNSISSSNGSYYVDLTFPIGSYSDYKKYRDKWVFDFGTKTITKTNYIDVLNPVTDTFDITDSKKIKLVLDKSESHRNIMLRLSISDKNVRFFRSWSKSEITKKYYPSDVSYRIYTLVNDSNYAKYYMTDWDRISKDKSGYYFDIKKDIFPIGKYYIEFKINVFDNTYYFADKTHFFKVTEDFSSDWL